MGNPFHITRSSARDLKKYGVNMYQISLDGLEKTHDYFRKPGSFNETLRAYNILREEGIKPLCMFTLSKLNMHELIDVINLAAEYKLEAFDFDRLVPIGSGENLKEDMISPLEYKEFLIKVENEYERLRKKGCQTHFGYKDNLWGLVDHNEVFKPENFGLPNDIELARGCLVGVSGLAILADGSAMACRRLPIILGKVPEQSIKDIFENSDVLKELRDMEKVDTCGTCDKFDDCKGCRAVAYGFSSGNYFSKDPQCWYEDANK